MPRHGVILEISTASSASRWLLFFLGPDFLDTDFSRVVGHPAFKNDWTRLVSLFAAKVLAFCAKRTHLGRRLFPRAPLCNRHAPRRAWRDARVRNKPTEIKRWHDEQTAKRHI
jgi:hypothetical protein